MADGNTMHLLLVGHLPVASRGHTREAYTYKDKDKYNCQLLGRMPKLFNFYYHTGKWSKDVMRKYNCRSDLVIGVYYEVDGIVSVVYNCTGMD